PATAGATPAASEQVAALPSFTLTDLDGKPLRREELANKVVLVEFWATWCPPCRSTLTWLGELRKRYGDRMAVLALAVESPLDQVKSTAAAESQKVRWAVADAPTAGAFGDIAAVPTLFIFDRNGKTADVTYGAPPDLHQKVEATLSRLL